MTAFPIDQASDDTTGGTLATAAMDKIIVLIRRGELLPGSIVNEADLAKRFDMSRGPVREAVRNLEGRKILVRENYHRARVTPLGRKEIRELFEFRECLEGMAARLAARAMDDAARDVLAEQIGPAAPSSSNMQYFTHEYRFNFHTTILNHCGNPRIRDTLLHEVYDLVRLYRWSSGAVPGRAGEAPREHWQIGRAVIARDEELAESLMRSHIQRSMQAELIA